MLRSRTLPNATYTSRKETVAAYHQLFEELIENEDAEPYYVNFKFNQLPGNRSTKIDRMTQDVIRFHGLLKRHIVRKYDKEGWRDLVPVLIGCPDVPVIKRLKVSVRLFQVNDGLHFNAVVFLPPRLQLPKITGERQSRLSESLVVHVEKHKAEYYTDKLYDIHVTPIIKGTTMADYTLKAFKNGHVSGDDILILNS